MKQNQEVVEQKPMAHVLLRPDGSAHSFFYMKDIPRSLLERTPLKVLPLCACSQETTTLLEKQTILDAKRWQTLMLAFENNLEGYLEVNSAPVGYDSAKLMWVEFGVKAPRGEKPTVGLFTAGVDAAIKEVEASTSKENPLSSKVSFISRITSKVVEQKELVCKAIAAAYSRGLHRGWDTGYKQGVEDERESEANIGVAGFGAKVEPNRNNPYKLVEDQTALQAFLAQPKSLVKLNFEQIEDCFPEEGCYPRNEDGALVMSAQWLHDFAHAVMDKMSQINSGGN